MNLLNTIQINFNMLISSVGQLTKPAVSGVKTINTAGMMVKSGGVQGVQVYNIFSYLEVISNSIALV